MADEQNGGWRVLFDRTHAIGAGALILGPDGEHIAVTAGDPPSLAASMALAERIAQRLRSDEIRVTLDEERTSAEGGGEESEPHTRYYKCRLGAPGSRDEKVLEVSVTAREIRESIVPGHTTIEARSVELARMKAQSIFKEFGAL